MPLDLERIAALLHIKEKLMGHPKLAAVNAHVDAELNNLAAEATKAELPERVLTAQEEEEAERAKAAAAAQEEANAATEQAKVSEEEMAERRQRDAAQALQPQATSQPAMQSRPLTQPTDDTIARRLD